MADVADRGDELLGRIVSVDSGQHRIGREVVPVRSGLENSLHDVFENATILFLRLSEGFLGAKMAGHRTLQFDEIAPQLKLRDHLMAENPQRLDLLGGRRQGHAGVKPDVRTVRDQRVSDEPRVRGCVLHREQIRLQNGVGGKGDVARGLCQVQSDPRLEPVAVGVHQAHQSDGGLADL